MQLHPDPLRGVYWSRYPVLLPILLAGVTDPAEHVLHVSVELLERVGVSFGSPEVQAALAARAAAATAAEERAAQRSRAAAEAEASRDKVAAEKLL